MSYTIGSDLYIYNQFGERLPRTEVAKLIDSINANFSRPVSVYLMSDIAQTELKVGIADDVSKRRYQHEYDRGFGVHVLHATAAIDRAGAGEIERSIHRFLSALGRPRTYATEWFKLYEHDVWLIRQMLNEMPLKAASAIFDVLSTQYPMYLAEHEKHPAYTVEEVRIGFGRNVEYHMQKEIAARAVMVDGRIVQPIGA